MRFSVIMPLFNKAQYVENALKSVLDQSFRDFELIVVDDGSTDDSYSVAQLALGASSIPYQLLHQENSGVSAARNNGFAVSCGDYVCFLDADDWWSTNYLEKMDCLIRDYPEAGIYGTNYYIVKQGRTRIAVQFAHTGYINYCQSYRKLQMPLWTGAVCIPRPVFIATEGFKLNLRLGEDFDVWIRIALKHKVAFLDEPLAFYYQDSDPTWRLVGKLHDPKMHMLWNLDYLMEEEKSNADYKRLIDELRTYGLLPYYLSPKYRREAKQELEKVDWEKQPRNIRLLYSQPLFFLKVWMCIRKVGSAFKQLIIRNI